MALIASEVGRLKPEIRLAKAISEFGACLNDDQRTRFKTFQTNSPPSPNEVIRLTEEINVDGSRLHKSWRPYGTRLVGILERIQLFSAVGDVLVGGAQNMIASGVWAVVRISLQLATGYLSYFEKVSELFMRIARSAPIKSDLALLFPRHKQLQEFMCEYLIVVVNFCMGVILFTKKPFFSQLAASFNKEFHDFEADLAMWSSLIQERASVLSTESQLRSENSITAANRTLSIFSRRKAKAYEVDKKLRRLQAHMSPYQQEFDPMWRRERKKGDARWIFNCGPYRAWAGSSRSSVLQVTGGLGSGKTVLMANIFATISSQGANGLSARGKPLLACFFCHFGTSKSLESRNIVGSLVYQFIKQLVAEPDVAEALAAKVPDNTSSFGARELVDFVETILPRDRNYYAVLDALDECSEQDAEDVVASMSKLFASCHLHICISSRNEPRITNIVTSHLSVEHRVLMATKDRDGELQAFIDEEIERRKAVRPLDPDLMQAVKRFLFDNANGMYLWVVLQIDALFPRYRGNRIICDADILHMLDGLPADLPQAFDRSLSRIADRRYGSRVFEIVASARRPLFLDEFRAVLNVEPGSAEWDESTLPHDAHSLVYLSGGGLLEVNEEDQTVNFIHSSALKYMSTNPHAPLDPETSLFRFLAADANMKMGYLCVTYLNYAVFETQLSKSSRTAVGMDRVSAGISRAVKHEATHNPIVDIAANATRWLRPAKSTTSEVDILQLLQKRRIDRIKSDTACRAFLSYACNYCLIHTKEFLLDDPQRFHSLLRRLVDGSRSHLALPWKAGDQAEAMAWAIADQHLEVFRCLLPYQLTPLPMSPGLGAFIATWPPSFNVEGKMLGGVVAQWVMDHLMVSRGDSLQEDLDILQKIISHGADPDAATPDGRTPLDLVVSRLDHLPRACSKYMTVLCQAGTDQDGPRSAVRQGNAIMHCLNQETPVALDLLLEHGANPNIALSDTKANKIFPFNKRRWLIRGDILFATSPLSVAIANGHLKMVKPLLKYGAKVDGNSEEDVPLRMAAQVDNSTTFKLLLDVGACIDANGYGGQSLAQYLATAGKLDFLWFMVKSPASLVCEDSRTRELALAIKERDRESTQRAYFTLPFPRDLDDGLFAFLDEHPSLDDVKILTKLLEMGVDANRGSSIGLGYPPLVAACRVVSEAADPGIVRTLLQFGALPGKVGPSGDWAFDHCITGGKRHKMLQHYRKTFIEQLYEVEVAVRTLDVPAFDQIVEFGSFPLSKVEKKRRSFKRRPFTSTYGSSYLFRIACEEAEGAGGDEDPSTRVAKQLYIVYSMLREGEDFFPLDKPISELLDRASEVDFIRAFVNIGLRIPDEGSSWGLPWEIPRSWMPQNIAHRRKMSRLSDLLKSREGNDYVFFSGTQEVEAD